MVTDAIARISSHHWLKHPHDESFHAFLSMKVGRVSVCGTSAPIVDTQIMQIPGERSVCCGQCTNLLYGDAVFPKKTKL